MNNRQVSGLAVIAVAAGLALAIVGGGDRCAVQGALPDRRCTPGAIDERITQSNIDVTICVRGYTATVRPPVSYTNPLKGQLMTRYGLGDVKADYELDHLIPLELGGNPTSTLNLWPEEWNGQYGAHAKDKVENELHRRVCAGEMALTAAQQAIATDWTKFAGDAP